MLAPRADDETERFLSQLEEEFPKQLKHLTKLKLKDTTTNPTKSRAHNKN